MTCSPLASRLWTPVVFAAVLIAAAPSSAYVIDQPFTTGATSLNNRVFGQSFTPPAGGVLKSFALVLSDANATLGDLEIVYTLYVGEGYGGFAIAERRATPATHPDLVSGNLVPIDFDVFVEAGQKYTVKVASVSGRGMVATNQHTFGGGGAINVDYPDGHLIDLNGNPQTLLDLKFQAVIEVQVFDGTSCSVSDNGDGTATVSCDDGTSAVLSDGTDGLDGTSCTVNDNGDGTSTVSCGDGTSAVIADGADGADGLDGTSCTVSDNGDGTSTVSCADGSSVVVSNGADGASGADGENGADGANGADGENGAPGKDGQPCSVTQNDDGTATITCPDGSEAVVGEAAGCSSVDARASAPFLALLGVLAARRRRPVR